jgi:glycosyltransferase involved in cell wall biosynthesis
MTNERSISHTDIKESLDVSIIIPVLNEAGNILPLYHAICSAMATTGRSWELIFVDDGSTDSTYQVLGDVHLQDERVGIIRLRRNFGQTAALTAGFDHARGAIIVSMDGDMQNDPEDIDALLKTIEDGYDVVSGWRVHRQEGFLLRRLPSQIANWLISRTTGVRLHDYGCTLKAYRADIVKELRLYGEMHRFIPALIAGNGARIAELPVKHHPRQYGRSKYGISRTVRVLLDLMTVKFCLSFLVRPLQIFGLLGLVTGMVGVGICAYMALLKLGWNAPLSDRPLLLLGVLLTVIGMQFLCIGILAEIQIRTYHEASNKLTYAVRNLFEPSHSKG